MAILFLAGTTEPAVYQPCTLQGFFSYRKQRSLHENPPGDCTAAERNYVAGATRRRQGILPEQDSDISQKINMEVSRLKKLKERLKRGLALMMAAASIVSVLPSMNVSAVNDGVKM